MKCRHAKGSIQGTYESRQMLQYLLHRNFNIVDTIRLYNLINFQHVYQFMIDVWWTQT